MANVDDIKVFCHVESFLRLPTIVILWINILLSFSFPEGWMGSLFLGLLSSFAILTSALSLPPSLSLISSSFTGISNYNSQTLSNLTSNPKILCSTVYGQILKVASCRNALQKIPRSSESYRFVRGRTKQQAPDQISTPIRYLSVDGICAIVCYPHLLWLFHSISLWFYKAVMRTTRQLGLVYRRLCSVEKVDEEPKLTTNLSSRTSSCSRAAVTMKLPVTWSMTAPRMFLRHVWLE